MTLIKETVTTSIEQGVYSSWCLISAPASPSIQAGSGGCDSNPVRTGALLPSSSRLCKVSKENPVGIQARAPWCVCMYGGSTLIRVL